MITRIIESRPRAPGTSPGASPCPRAVIGRIRRTCVSSLLGHWGRSTGPQARWLRLGRCCVLLVPRGIDNTSRAGQPRFRNTICREVEPSIRMRRDHATTSIIGHPICSRPFKQQSQNDIDHNNADDPQDEHRLLRLWFPELLQWNTPSVHHEYTTSQPLPRVLSPFTRSQMRLGFGRGIR